RLRADRSRAEDGAAEGGEVARALGERRHERRGGDRIQAGGLLVTDEKDRGRTGVGEVGNEQRPAELEEPGEVVVARLGRVLPGEREAARVQRRGAVDQPECAVEERADPRPRVAERGRDAELRGGAVVHRAVDGEGIRRGRDGWRGRASLARGWGGRTLGEFGRGRRRRGGRKRGTLIGRDGKRHRHRTVGGNGDLL